MSVCLSRDSNIATEAALRLMPPGEDCPRLDFNDPQVFGEYYDLFFLPFVQLVRSMTPLDDAAAEDIVQTAFMKAMRVELPPLMWRQFRRWVRRAVVYGVLTYWRSQGRLRQWVSIDVDEGDEGAGVDHSMLLCDPAPSVEEQMLLRERLREVVQMRQQGRVSHQQLVRVLLEWGYDARQVAAYIERQGMFGAQLAVVGDQLVRAAKPAFRCKQCGSSAHKHQGYGLCVNCYQRQLRQRRAQGQPLRHVQRMPTFQCTGCGTTEGHPHGHGLCEECYRHLIRSQPQAGFQCVECGTTERRQIARELCEPCYRRDRRRFQGVVQRTNQQLTQAS